MRLVRYSYCTLAIEPHERLALSTAVFEDSDLTPSSLSLSYRLHGHRPNGSTSRVLRAWGTLLYHMEMETLLNKTGTHYWTRLLHNGKKYESFTGWDACLARFAGVRKPLGGIRDTA